MTMSRIQRTRGRKRRKIRRRGGAIGSAQLPHSLGIAGVHGVEVDLVVRELVAEPEAGAGAAPAAGRRAGGAGTGG